MEQIRKLAGQTAIYGLGTIVPRFLNYALLTPFYTRIFDTGEYGIVTELYAYMVVLLVILTYGMETGYFRFASKENQPEKVYSTALGSLLITSLLFILAIILFNQQIADVMKYSDNKEYILFFSLIISIDACTAIPFAKLRREERGLKFALIKIINVVVIIGLALFFYILAPKIYSKDPSSIINLIYSPEVGVGYVFIANLAGSIVTIILLFPEITGIRIKIDKALWKKMIKYSYPLLIAGLAGTINDVVDKIALKHLLTDQNTAMNQLGIYGASYKIGVIMALFIQMFRYAFEPFVFANSNDKNAREIYAVVMKYFVLFGLFIFLGVVFYLDIIVKLLLGNDFIVSRALEVVPIILIGYLLYGIFVNLSVWYKINELTKFGAIITGVGALITVVINVSLVPVFGYHASAWAHIACYLTMVIMSYYIGKRYYKIPYETVKIIIYFVFGLALYWISRIIRTDNEMINIIMNTGFLILFVVVISWNEKIKWKRRQVGE
ncbi:MAG: polysaccharide biosynthesis protein [Bacteroidales bacterium]|nr:polysaccharide biosynthesis protein [Bacteroidales bacterium]